MEMLQQSIADLMAVLVRLYHRIVAPPLAPVSVRGDVPVGGSAPTPPPPVSIKPAKKQTANGHEPESGAFYFRDSILDQLDKYFFCLRRMRKEDREAYDLYRQVGGYIMPDHYIMSREIFCSLKVSPWFRSTLPAFGAVAIAINPDLDREKRKGIMSPRFLYFQKVEPSKQFRKARLPPIPKGYTVYLIAAYWDTYDSDDKYNVRASSQFAVVVLPDGSVQVLRTHDCYQATVQAKHRYGGGNGKSRKGLMRNKQPMRRGETFTIPQQRWRIHPFLVDWAKENTRNDAEAFLTEVFCLATANFEHANYSMVRVDVANKDDLHAVFSVDIKRTPYFFKDRDVTINEAGSKRRIFHVVRPHARIGAGGNERFVRLHFRGERQFRWHDYDVKITVPGRHHRHLAEFDIAPHLLTEDEPVPPRLIGPAAFGKTLRQHLDGKVCN